MRMLAPHAHDTLLCTCKTRAAATRVADHPQYQHGCFTSVRVDLGSIRYITGMAESLGKTMEKSYWSEFFQAHD
jgi:hypothetical protein